jgi:flagellar hook-associated protein 2
MSENEIRIWEEQAQTGLLHRDSMLRSILNDMRQVMSTGITLADGTNFSLAHAGIRLSPNPADGGILVFNTDERLGPTFEHALANNMEQIAALFTGAGVTHVGGSTQGVNEMTAGLAVRLDTALDRYINEWGSGVLADRAGVVGRANEHNNAFARQIEAQDRRIETALRWLERRENQLFAQFSRMELAMMQAQQQMMFWDSIMFGQQ